MLLSACADDIDDRYANIPVFMRVQPVTALTPLFTAANNPGFFCALEYDKPYYIARGTHGAQAQMNGTALEGYGKPLYISGIVTGTPSLPDMHGEFYLVAYDQVCPNCYLEFFDKKLRFPTQTTAFCDRCRRTYDLNTDGIVINGEAGKPLLRYRVQYDRMSDVLIVR